MIYIVRVLGLLLNILLGILSYIVPKNKRLIVLGSHRGSVHSFSDNTKAFFLYMLNANLPYNVYWFTHNKNTYKYCKERRLPVLHGIKAFIKILRANYLILAHGPIDISYFYYLPGKFNIIQTWHGIALKDISKQAMSKWKLSLRMVNYLSRMADKKYKLIIATSEETKKIFIKMFNNNNVKIIGYPRNDIFYNRNLVLEDYRDKFGLYKFKRVILYAPTFRENKTKQPFTPRYLKLISEYLTTNNYILLIKRHHYDTGLYDGIDINNYLNIKDISNEVMDIQELLIHVDILISDYSSIMFDFVLLDRPIIFYPYDMVEYISNCRSLLYNYYDELPGPFATNEEELLQLLKDIDNIFNSTEYKERYNKFKSKHHYYNDGNSSERLFKALLELSQ